VVWHIEFHTSCFAKAARRPSGYKFIDALIAAAKQLLWQLEEVKLANAHDKRAHGRPRPRSASSKRSIPKSDLAATFKAIVKEAQAQLAELGKLETHEPETQEQEVSVLSSQGQAADQIPTEQLLSERRTGGSNLRFPYLLSQLEKNMVATI
jgi:hypothetical protein